MTVLYLIRHGETDLNRQGVLQGHIDCGLNKTGIEQAERVAKVLKDVEFDGIISSPLKRAYKTASILIEGREQKIERMEELKEISFGIWEGMDYKEIIASYPSEWKEWENNWTSYAAKGGENFENFFGRVRIALEDILERYENKKIAIVSHDGVMKALTVTLLKMKYQGFWNFYFEHGKYSLYEVQKSNCTIKRINV